MKKVIVVYELGNYEGNKIQESQIFEAKENEYLTVHNTDNGLLLVNLIKENTKPEFKCEYLAVYKSWQYWRALETK